MAAADMQGQSDGCNEIITLITFVLSTERTGRDDKSKAKQAASPYRCDIIAIDRPQCIFGPVLKLKPHPYGGPL